MIRFKTPLMETEFNSAHLDNRVRLLLFTLAGWSWYTLDKFIKITSVYRSDAEQIALYGGGMPPFGNVHGAWRAIDFVIEDAKGNNLEALKCERIATLFNKYIQHDTKNKYPTLLFHSVGHGWHFHLQVSYNNVTKLNKEQ